MVVPTVTCVWWRRTGTESPKAPKMPTHGYGAPWAPSGAFGRGKYVRGELTGGISRPEYPGGSWILKCVRIQKRTVALQIVRFRTASSLELRIRTSNSMGLHHCPFQRSRLRAASVWTGGCEYVEAENESTDGDVRRSWGNAGSVLPCCLATGEGWAIDCGPDWSICSDPCCRAGTIYG